jgi:hypothetical protein
MAWMLCAKTRRERPDKGAEYYAISVEEEECSDREGSRLEQLDNGGRCGVSTYVG